MEYTLTLSHEEKQLIVQLLNDRWHDLDQRRMLAPADSPEEKSHLADQIVIEGIRGNLSRKSVTPSR